MITRYPYRIGRSFTPRTFDLICFIFVVALFLAGNPRAGFCSPAGEVKGATLPAVVALPGGHAEPSAGVLADSTPRKGREIFLKNCASCHGEQGQGVAGPNLTDKYWIHSGGIKNVSATIRDGIAGKGMIGWKDLLFGAELQNVSLYVLSLQGTNPPKGKKPEGTLYHERESDGSKER